MYKRLFTSVSSGHAFSTDDHIKGRDDRLNEKNVCDRLLSELPKEDREFLQEEYDILVDNAEELPFIERVVTDSRSIGLYHTSGLSTPSQVFMDFMALTHLVYENKDEYIKLRNRHEITCTSCLSIFPMSASENLVVARYDFGFLPCPRKNILRNLYILFRDSSLRKIS